MRKLALFVLVFFCFLIVITFAQQPNGGGKAEPTNNSVLLAAEKRFEQAKVEHSRAYLNAVNANMNDSLRALGALAELQKAHQNLVFAEQIVEGLKKK